MRSQFIAERDVRENKTVVEIWEPGEVQKGKIFYLSNN
jgi:hypothetical protein